MIQNFGTIPPAIMYPPNADLALIETSHLERLASYFENEARRLRNAAYENRRRERSNESARQRREEAKGAWLTTGARAHVLRTRGLEWPQIAARLIVAHDVARVACGEWRRKKQARRQAKRNAEIFREVCAGVERDKIAERHGITARQVRSIAATVHARLIGEISQTVR